MGVERDLLTLGNKKLGESIHVWSLEAIKTCPGATKICRNVCYATKHRYQFPVVADRLGWNYEQSQKRDFDSRMIKEIRRKGCLVIRIHGAGDFYNVEYAEKWLTIMRACPRPRFYFYTRSWTIPGIAAVLAKIAALRCCKPWYSIDKETGMPDFVPPGVRLAYLQTEEAEIPVGDLTFRVKRLRKNKRVGLPMVCL